MRKRESGAPMTKGEAYRKALKRGTRYRRVSVNPAVVILVLFLVLVIVLCSVIIAGRYGAGSETPPVTTDEAAEESGITPDPEEGTGTVISLGREDVYRGNLILVNSDFGYVFPESPTDVSVYDNKTYSYKVNNKNVTMSMECIRAFNVMLDDFYAETGCRDVMVVSGFRSEEFQRELYDERVATDGAEEAAKYVALPGHSEHHTGLAMDLSVYTDSGEGYPLRTYEGCKWLVGNFENYGFVLRYPEEKAPLTGISYESWHYRYVGAPHSLIMKRQDMCLEEYVEYVRFLDEGTAVTWNGTDFGEADIAGTDGLYAVYYVPAEESGDTKIRIPEGREYTVSGDNIGGFIITLMP